MSVRGSTSKNAWTPEQAARAIRWPFRILLATTVACPVLSAMMTVGHPDYSLALTLLTACALGSNFVAALPHLKARLLRIGSVLMGGIALPLALVSVVPTMLLPVEVYNETETRLLVIITYLVVMSAYFAGAADVRLPAALPIVPALSVFGLIASKNFGPEIINAFVVFTLASLGLLTYEIFLRHAEDGLVALPAIPDLLLRQLGLIGCWGGTVVLLSLVLWPVVSGVTPELTLLTSGPTSLIPPPRPLPPSYTSFFGPLDLSGGSYEFSDTVWMQVRTPQSQGRWRGRVLREYSGHGWSPEPLERLRPLPREEGWWVLRAMSDRHRRVRDEFLPHVRMPAIVYSSGDPLRVRCDQTVQMNEADFTAHVRFLMERDVSYTVESEVPMGSQEQLEHANLQPPEEITRRYLDLPATTEAVQQLARDTTAAASTPFLKAQAVKRYLAEHCTYSLRSPTIPREEDAVTYFVTVSREGACDLFGSALVVMCRAVGIPARLVTGFLDSGERNRGWAIVRERDAHAWAEVYIAPYGWISLDPTETANVEATTLQLLAQTLFSREVWEPARALRALPALALGLIVLIALSQVAVVVLRTRVDRSPARQITTSYLSACRTLARRGLVRIPSQTPWEFLRIVDNSEAAAPVRDHFRALTAASIHANFSPDRVSVEDVVRARQSAQAVRKGR